MCVPKLELGNEELGNEELGNEGLVRRGLHFTDRGIRLFCRTSRGSESALRRTGHRLQ